MPSRALVVLEDGLTFRGEALVGFGTVGGELVFTTSIGGYQEIASDPSYHGQIVTYTFPMNGNYGVAPEWDESAAFGPVAIIAREITGYRFNHQATDTWLSWLKSRGCLAVTGVDTRALTRHIRERGAMRAVVSTETRSVENLRELACSVPPMAGRDLTSEVTCRQPYEVVPPGGAPATYHVVAYDFGVKRSILRLLAAQGCRITVVPARTPPSRVLALKPDGVLLSNGPGDPAAVKYAIRSVRGLLGKVPVFGICLGHQLLALALGLQTYKLPFGHRGANHPVKDLHNGAIEITTQNHGFAVRPPAGWSVWLPHLEKDGKRSKLTLAQGVPGSDGACSGRAEGSGGSAAGQIRWQLAKKGPAREVEITHVNLNDGTIEGLAVPELHAFSVQYHPEAAPGPHDARHLFGRFVAEMRRWAESGAGHRGRRERGEDEHD